jgi:hypothetical protein
MIFFQICPKMSEEQLLQFNRPCGVYRRRKNRDFVGDTTHDIPWVSTKFRQHGIPYIFLYFRNYIFRAKSPKISQNFAELRFSSFEKISQNSVIIYMYRIAYISQGTHFKRHVQVQLRLLWCKHIQEQQRSMWCRHVQG